MVLSKDIQDRIVDGAYAYVGKPFDYDKFNCVHFVRIVYCSVGINLPLLDPNDFPPADFHLSAQEFASMPVGHSVFFKRKGSVLIRPWTHLAIIVSPKQLIHCTRHFEKKVTVTDVDQFLEVYRLVPKPL